MVRFKKFDVLTIAEGEKHPHEQYGLQAANENELRNLLAMTGERILEIRRVYDGDFVKDSNTNPEYLLPQNKVPNSVLTTLNDPNESTIAMQNMEKAIGQTQNLALTVTDPQIQQTQRIAKPISAPKFYSVGGIDIKEQDGKIYQKQWIRVPESEFRLVSDSSNKVIPLKGKHLETLKWVQVESTSDEEHNGGKELLLG